MPRLILFAACSQVIQDIQDRSLSLISLLNGVRTNTPADPETPGGIKVQTPWAAVAVWLRVPEDEGKTFEQLVEIVPPDSEPVGGAHHQFQIQTRTHNIGVNGDSFPTKGEGEHMVRLSFREANGEWQVVAEYPIYVAYTEAGLEGIE